jgi:hypothetical protein
MSLIGILASNLFSAGTSDGSQNATPTPNHHSSFQQIKAEFQQLGQDLQAGNLTQAQADYTTLSKDLPNLTQPQSSTNALAQAFTQLGKDLQTGNLQAAQSDYATVQQDAQQVAAQAQGHRHHHHHSESEQESATTAVTSPIVKDFSTLAQDLQAGNLSGAQSAFAALQNDLQKIGGFYPAGSTTATGASGAAAQPSSGGVSVTA